MEIEKDAIALLDAERTAWEDEEAFITDRVSFNVRNLIRQCRQNYAGIFAGKKDRMNRTKTWVPMTESVVEATVKNNDLDQKDFVFKAKKSGAILLAHIVRGLIMVHLDKIFFNELLDDFIRRLSIDGTAIWKTGWDSEKNCLKVTHVDPLNFYIDPVSTGTQKGEASRITERSLMTPEEVAAHSGWLNTKSLLSSNTINPNDPRSSNTGRGTAMVRDVWESFGAYPEYLITGNKNDQKMVEMHIVVSGLEVGDPQVHKVERWNEVRPYELGWYQKFPGRIFGRGVAEKLLMLQSWINLVINTRITRHSVSQLGLWKIRRGSNITPEMLSRLATNGAIAVNNMDDLEQVVMQEASQSSYMDEQNIYSWAEKVTAAFEVVTGEQLPSSTTATAVATQSRSAQSQFVLIKKGIGNFLERWMRRQAMPLILKNLKKGDVLRITGEPEAMQAIVERKVEKFLAKEMDKATKMGQIIDPEEMKRTVQSIMGKFADMGVDAYWKHIKDLDPFEFDVLVQVTNSKIDQQILAQNLVNTFSIAPELKGWILPQLADTLGLDTMGLMKEIRRIEQMQQEQMQRQQMMEQAGTQAGVPQGAPQVPAQAAALAGASTAGNAPKY